MELTYIVKSSDESIKQILKNKFNMSDRFILKLKNHKAIFVNGVSVFINFEIHDGDVLRIIENFEEDSSNIVANDGIVLKILFEDDFLLIVDKPAGIPVHPSMAHYEDSLSNGVKAYFDRIGLRKKVRPVNRLDRDTSGVVIFAKNEYVQECLVRQMAAHVFRKRYLAVLDGVVVDDSGTIDAPIARRTESIIEREVRADGDVAVSHFRVLERFSDMTVVEFLLETGRTHQLRVHSKYIGHPIVGDSLYGSESVLIGRQALHACEVGFVHPIGGQDVVVTAEVPEDIRRLIERL